MPKLPKTINRHPSMQTVANAAGVSKMTVSWALRGDPRISEATRERVKQAAKSCGYEFNPVLSEVMHRIQSRHRGALGLTVALPITLRQKQHVTNGRPYRNSIIRACFSELKRLGFEANWLDITDLSAKRIAQIIRSRNIAALYLPVEANLELMSFIRTGTIPAVSTAPYHQQDSIYTVASDYGWALQHALAEVSEFGFRRPAYLAKTSIEILTCKVGIGQFRAWAPHDCIFGGSLVVDDFEATENRDTISRWRLPTSQTF